jgi:ATP-binding cassette subfamily A (ABC1) protein 3
MPFCHMGVIIQSVGPKWKYVIRQNSTGSNQQRDYPRQVPATSGALSKNKDQSVAFDPTFLPYTSQGFIFMQKFMDQLILKQTATSLNTTLPSSLSPISPDVMDFYQPFPNPSYLSDNFADYVGFLLGFLLTLMYMMPVSSLIKLLVEEKEKKIKEGMKMMGLGETAHFLSWASTYLILYALISLVIALISMSSLYKYSNRGLIFLFYFLFSCTAFSFSYLISTIFSKATVGSTVGALVFLGIFFSSFGVTADTATAGTYTTACLSSPSCFSFGVAVITRYTHIHIFTYSPHIHTFTHSHIRTFAHSHIRTSSHPHIPHVHAPSHMRVYIVCSLTPTIYSSLSGWRARRSVSNTAA